MNVQAQQGGLVALTPIPIPKELVGLTPIPIPRELPGRLSVLSLRSPSGPTR